MNEEIIRQILHNQIMILAELRKNSDNKEMIDKYLNRTDELLYPKEEQSLPDKTENALGEDRK